MEMLALNAQTERKNEGRIEYYTRYTNGFETEVGANIVVFDFFSVSMGADAIWGQRVAFEFNCIVGISVDLSQ